MYRYYEGFPQIIVTLIKRTTGTTSYQLFKNNNILSKWCKEVHQQTIFLQLYS